MGRRRGNRGEKGRRFLAPGFRTGVARLGVSGQGAGGARVRPGEWAGDDGQRERREEGREETRVGPAWR